MIFLFSFFKIREMFFFTTLPKLKVINKIFKSMNGIVYLTATQMKGKNYVKLINEWFPWMKSNLLKEIKYFKILFMVCVICGT